MRFRKPKHLKNAWYDKYVKIHKYTRVRYQKVEHTNFYVNIPKNAYAYDALVFLGFQVSGDYCTSSDS